MLKELKAKYLFHTLLKRPNINKAYAMVGPEDSWYDTITTVHESLKKIQALPHEILIRKSHDGLKLKAVYYPSEGKSRGTVIYVHGYTSHAERESAFPALFYHSLGFNVLIPYLRAHGLSQGKYISLGALETVDIMGWVRTINRKRPNDSIMIHGSSMGGGIVLSLSDQRMDNVKCMLADAPSTSVVGTLKRKAKDMFDKDGSRIARYAIKHFNEVFDVNAGDYDGLHTVKFSRYPLLVAAGSEENRSIVLAKIKKRNPQPTDVVILPGCSHGNGMYKQTEMYQKAIESFLDRYIPKSER